MKLYYCILAVCFLLASAIQDRTQDGGITEGGRLRRSESLSLDGFPFHADFELIDDEIEHPSTLLNFIELENGASGIFRDAFKKVKAIGRGNYGTVYSAYAKKDGAAGLTGIRKGERVAIKKFVEASNLAKEQEINEALKTAIEWTEDRLSQCTLRPAALPNIRDGGHEYIVRYRGMICEPPQRGMDSDAVSVDEKLAKEKCYLVFSFFGRSALYNLYWKYKKSLNPFAPTIESHCDLNRVLNIANQVQEALRFLRSHGILHADVSSTNILVDGKQFDRAKLIDFGVSRTFTDGDNTKRQMTLIPEFVKDIRAVYPRFDTLSNIINIERILAECEKQLPVDVKRRALQRRLDDVSNNIPFDVGTANGFSVYLSVLLKTMGPSLITNQFDSVPSESAVDCRPETIYEQCDALAKSKVDTDLSHTEALQHQPQLTSVEIKEDIEFFFSNCVKWVAHKCEVKNYLSLDALKEVELIVQGCEYKPEETQFQTVSEPVDETVGETTDETVSQIAIKQL